MINKLKVEDAGKVIMPAGKLLVVAMKERKHTVVRPIPVAQNKAEQEFDEDGRPALPVTEVENVKSHEPYYVQFYKVISAHEKEEEYPVGTIVMASFMAGSMYDLIPKTKVLNKFDVLSKFVEN